jgi:argininosuccinate lyase
MNATELADYLVRKGMPFREAHEVVGKIVMRAIESGKELDQLSLSELQAFSGLVAEDVHVALSLEQTVESKSQIGGTSPTTVSAALAKARESLQE